MFSLSRRTIPGEKVYYLLEVSPNSADDSFLDDWTADQVVNPCSGLRKYHVCTTVDIIAAIAKFAVTLGVRDSVAALLYLAKQTQTESDRPDSDRPHV